LEAIEGRWSDLESNARVNAFYLVACESRRSPDSLTVAACSSGRRGKRGLVP